MNKPLDPAYVAALRCKPWVPPEIYGYPAAARRKEPSLKLPAAPALIQEAETGLDWHDAACIVAAVVVWVLVASMKVWP